jgi:dolichol-phosphate mannosyltransferase
MGDAVAWMSSDMQNPPELLPTLLQRWEGGGEVAWAVRPERHDPWPRRVMALLFYRLLSVLRYPPILRWARTSV